MKGGEKPRLYRDLRYKQKRTLLSEIANRSQLGWMPKSDQLYYVSDNSDGRNDLPARSVDIGDKGHGGTAPQRKIPYRTGRKIDVLLLQRDPFGHHAKRTKEDDRYRRRQTGYRDRTYIYRYFFETGVVQQITFGRQSASLNDITDDVRYLLFSTSEEDCPQRPFRKSSLYMLDLATMTVDTIWKDQAYTYSAQFSPDGKKLLIHGAPEAFNGIGLNIDEGQIANSYDTQSFIMDLATRKVDPRNEIFQPVDHCPGVESR
jgi:Tol biopolymer transport system component